MNKYLFENNGAKWTKEGQELDVEAHRVLKDLFEKWCMVKGYSPREVSHVISGTVMGMELETLVRLKAKNK